MRFVLMVLIVLAASCSKNDNLAGIRTANDQNIKAFNDTTAVPIKLREDTTVRY